MAFEIGSLTESGAHQPAKLYGWEPLGLLVSASPALGLQIYICSIYVVYIQLYPDFYMDTGYLNSCLHAHGVGPLPVGSFCFCFCFCFNAECLGLLFS